MKVTLLPSVVNGWQPGYALSPGLRPAVRNLFGESNGAPVSMPPRNGLKDDRNRWGVLDRRGRFPQVDRQVVWLIRLRFWNMAIRPWGVQMMPIFPYPVSLLPRHHHPGRHRHQLPGTPPGQPTGRFALAVAEEVEKTLQNGPKNPENRYLPLRV